MSPSSSGRQLKHTAKKRIFEKLQTTVIENSESSSSCKEAMNLLECTDKAGYFSYCLCWY